jgi:outer membrane protein OmpA-like peptidoglycan-associated protein
LQPVAGVELKFADANGNILPSGCFPDGQQPQTTGNDGRYRFDLSVACTSVAGEEFQIVVTNSNGYSLLPTANGLQADVLNPGTPSSEVYEVVSYDNAPSASQARKFYTSFLLGFESRQIANNHIPLTRLSKLIEDDLRTVLRDDLIATMTQQSRQMAGYATGALQRLKDNSDNSCSAAIAAQLAQNPVLFETALVSIKPESDATLDTIANLLALCSETTFDVEGHTDSRGDEGYNEALSKARAVAVVTALRDRGVPTEQLSAKGYGETRPIADNETLEGRALNRRVVFTVVDRSANTSPCTEEELLERSFDLNANQNGTSVDGQYFKESRDCAANSWTTWEGAATYLKTDTGMSQGMLNITRRHERLLNNDRLRGYFLGAYATNNDVTGLATGTIKGFGLTAGSYGAQRFSSGLFLDYYLGASAGRHSFNLDFYRASGVVNADGYYDYFAAFAGLALSGETKVGDYKIVPRAGFEAAWSPGGEADYVASRDAISDASNLDTGSVRGGRLFGELRIDDLAPNKPYQLAFTPKFFCDRPLGGGDGLCGMGASIELSSTVVDGKGQITFELEGEKTRDTQFLGLTMDYSVPVWAGQVSATSSVSSQGSLALGVNYERAF